MNDKEKIARMSEALEFYANSGNYWGRPIPLETPLDKRTLGVAMEHREDCPVIRDWGGKALAALVEIGHYTPKENDDE